MNISWTLVTSMLIAFSKAQQGEDQFLEELANDVKSSNSQEMVSAIAFLMGKPQMQNDVNLMRENILRLIRDPKFQMASNGRKTVKAVRLPSGVINLLNAPISVESKKNILDKVF